MTVFRGHASLLSLLLIAAVPGCREDDADPPRPSLSDDGGLSAVRRRARQADRFMVHYGDWTPEAIQAARRHQVVVVHPSQGHVTRDIVAAIRQGVDPADPSDDVLVLGYISVGEDLRTRTLTDAQLAADPRFRGDGSGPRVDPRGPDADGRPLDGIDPRGAPSPGGTRFASWYLDDNSVDRTGRGDGLPDRNGRFGGAFVNAGDPAWFALLQDMTLDGPDGLAGFREILATDYGRGLGCDGVFLDTIDTCAPNRFTDPSSDNQSEFEWTAPGFSAFIRRVRAAYPNAVILQNRGLFFYDPRHPHYAFSPRGAVDLVLFESFRLNSHAFEEFSPYFYPDNRFNVAPKLIAESQRPDGFRIVSLGYAEGPPDRMSRDTLVGRSTVGLDSLLEDIRVTQELHGFRHYLTDAPVLLANTFVLDHANLTDAAPPRWSSTYNPHTPPFPTPPSEPPPRVGLQEAVPGPGSLTVRWDVALDLHPVRYTLYYQTRPFDFAADPDLRSAARIALVPEVGAGYAQGPGPDRYPFQATISGLVPGQVYYLVLRASDTSPAAHEEKNQVVRTAAPLGSP
ncbi:MAG TPA: hypothetical protein VNO22_18175 [Planctomycetota bacterium]|nr:hypothetical protein [Planctomycetota bacterium]